MEIEREPRKPSTPHARLSKPSAPRSVPSTTTAKFERVTYAREACYILGALLITVGLVGFVVDNLMGMHLSYAHNMIHVIAGVGAVISAYNSRKAARTLAFTFGVIFGALGILGFIFGLPAEPTIGHATRDASLWVLSPEVLEFGTSDHLLHLVLAAAFIIAASVHRQRRTDNRPDKVNWS